MGVYSRQKSAEQHSRLGYILLPHRDENINTGYIQACGSNTHLYGDVIQVNLIYTITKPHGKAHCFITSKQHISLCEDNKTGRTLRMRAQIIRKQRILSRNYHGLYSTFQSTHLPIRDRAACTELYLHGVDFAHRSVWVCSSVVPAVGEKLEDKGQCIISFLSIPQLVPPFYYFQA